MALVITGANALVKISGNVVLFAGVVSVDHEMRLEEIPQLDNLEVAEYAENGHRCQVVINSFKLASDATLAGQKISNNASDFGLDPASVSKYDVQIDELNNILLQPEMIIEIVNPVPVRDGNGNIVDYHEVAIYQATGAKFAGGTGSLDARGVWQGVWNFKARRGTGI